MRTTENMTLSIPKGTVKRMKRFRQIRWSVVASDAIEKEIKKLEDAERFEELETILLKSKLKKQDVEKISRRIKAETGKKF
ncbi:hypothetical protein M1614_03415 [Candidatus Marsarchaeota archaeon]|nr:hypothetical protein [Candidatus Marsarchaeota archaeon]